MRTIVSSYYTPTGNKVDVIDPFALQTELNNMESTDIGLQASVQSLVQRTDKLEKIALSLERLVSFCCEHHPEVVNEFLVTERAKIRLETGV